MQEGSEMLSQSLRRVPLFSSLSDEQIAALNAVAQRRSFRRGEVIFHKGDAGPTLFMITQGQVKIVLPSDGGGEEALLGVMDTGDFFGELSLIDEQPRSATIVASEDTDTLVLHRVDFLEFLSANPELAIVVMRVLCRRLREADEFIEDAIFLDVPGRLAKKLLELAETYGRDTPYGTVIGLRMTQQELAAMVGATRESVNKHLRAYRARGIIEIDRQRIIIYKPEELQRRIY
ncbi:MAG: Crp/Fnr family transcriptional regulator [Chloroflexi bacterium]|nr:Crp/Fnr family transcriptional regulator [Chloroflexota bacterium]